ncbi:trans-2,3-enoyl-CoA reductase-like 2b isoform X1 [Triplophysa dalaica]|uniref:trans-2,3-enoyl-CoA reductase-like 2b isoform X1 n=1 Tax=Triplophysa dalaica TaxID=1582913 RepID=UPI0024DFEECD|nr:trans-2,3-enoyl-CoA reductase-like 2b isoform X1 [Triplophysa dalaica]
MDLRDLFTVAQFIKARCKHGMKASTTKDKNYVFFEVEIVDPKSKVQLCYLDKVEPNATIAEIKTLLHKIYPKFYPSRQALKLHPEGKALSDDDVLKDLPVGTTTTMFFQDLGPQLGWAMVFLAECLGPLFVYLLFYFRLPYIYSPEYDYTQSPFKVVQLAGWCHTLHYIKKLVETIFIHRFSDGTLPLRTIMQICLYYWGFAAWQAYYINHPLYTPATYGKLQIYSALAMFLICECGNFSVHLVLNQISCIGSRPTEIPYPTRNPLTWLFFFVSCPNYTYELLEDAARKSPVECFGCCVYNNRQPCTYFQVGSWLSFTVMTQCVPVGVFAFLGLVQMTMWARANHKTYIQEFEDYPVLRSAIIPLFI